MALLSVANAKDYLRIQDTAEDTPLAAWLLSCVAAVEAEIGTPITAEERTFVVERSLSNRQIFVPLYPIAGEDSAGGIAALTIEDKDGTVLLEDTDYRLDHRSGVITAIESCFTAYPYTITAWVGLSALAEYSTKVEPIVNAAILDLLADRYQRRNPAATNEDASAPSQSFTTFNPGLPQRVRDLLAPLCKIPIA